MAKIKKRDDGRYSITKVINGKRKYFYGKTKTEALNKLEEYTENVNENAVYSSDMTLEQWCINWLSIKKHEIAVSTHESYTGIIRRYIIPHIGFIKLYELNINHLRNFLGKMMDKGLSTRSITYTQTILKAVLQQAVDDELLTKNPASSLKRPKPIKKKKIVTLTKEQVTQYIDAITNEEHKALFKLAFASGLRRSELLGLRWCDVDMANKTLTVNQTAIKINGHSEISPTTKTDSSHRTITIDDVTMSVLKRHKTIINKRRMKCHNWINNDLVFPGARGNPKSPDELTKLAKRYAMNINVDDFTMHCTRHTHATLLIESGINFKVVQTRLGHASFEETMNIYAHVTPLMEMDVVKIIQNIF